MIDHTPGPWKLNGNRLPDETVSASIFDITAEGGSFEEGLYWFKAIVPCVRIIDGKAFYGFSSREDARLIAAAPDLLAALVAIVKVIDRADDRECPAAALEMARAAIKRAEGK